MSAIKSSVSKGLFITFEGIAPTIFDSQVALHAREMKEWGIELEIWAFETWPGMFQHSQARQNKTQELAQVRVSLFRGVVEYFPLSGLFNALLLIYIMVRRRPNITFIHARADYATAVCGFVAKLWHIPVIWDCRGDGEAEFEAAYRPGGFVGRIAKWAYLKLISWRTSFAARSCTRAIFVSDELRRRKGKALGNKISEVIPTSVSHRIFFVSVDLRQVTRVKYGYKPWQRVLLYSGGMTSYQGFAEYVRMFKALYGSDSELRFLVATPDLERASKLLAELPDVSYSLLAASFEDMNALYNAADFGILLRERNPVNDVASPTKFGEYCLTGLPIVMNDSVLQSYRFASEFGNLIPFGVDLTPGDLIVRTSAERSAIAMKARNTLSRENLAHRYFDIYSI